MKKDKQKLEKTDKKNFLSNKGTHYFEYLGSSLLILLIPIIIISIYFNSRFIKQFKEEIYDTVDMELYQISIQVDNKIAQMKETSARLAIEKQFSDATKSKDPYDLLPLINYLALITSANDYYEDIWVNIYRNDYMVTSSTTWKKNLFYSHNFDQNQDIAKEKIDALYQGFRWPLCISLQDISTKNNDDILFILPLYSDYLERDGSIAFKVRKSTFDSMISNRMKSYHALIFIEDNLGNIIYTNSQDQDVDNLTQEDYTKRLLHSESTGWNYYAILPDTQYVFANVSNISREYIITISIILLISGALIIFLLQKLYAPIQTLGEKIKTVIPEDENKNEFKGISKALDILATKNTDLESTLNSNMVDIRNSRLYRLINGAYQSRADFNTDNEELGIPLIYDYVSVLIVHVKSDEIDIKEYAESEKKRLKDIYTIYYCTEVGKKKQIVFIFNSGEEQSARKLAENLMKHALDNHLVLTIGIGCKTSDLTKVGQSFIEASSALDYRFIKGNNTIIDFSEISGNINDKSIYPNSEMMALSNALSAHNQDAILGTLDQIIAIIKKDDMPIYLVRSIISDMMTLINKSISLSEDRSAMTISLSKADNVQEAIELAEKWKEMIKASLKAEKNTEAAMKDIQQYIDDNCLKADFSAYETADRFNLTLPNLSKMFKDYSGKNLIDYTTEIRINTAKKLLCETSLPISEIAEKIGYYNLSSFTRRFKQSLGISPSEYRALHREN